jgi:hypothetical protein
MHFSMVIFLRKSTCSHLLAPLILRIKFVAFAVLSMVLSKLLGPSLLSLVMWLLSRVSPLVLMIQLSSFAIRLLVSLSFRGGLGSSGSSFGEIFYPNRLSLVYKDRTR